MRKIKLSLLADDMITYVENQKERMIKLQELISDYSMVVGYSANIQKSLAFQYPTNGHVKFEIKT